MYQLVRPWTGKCSSWLAHGNCQCTSWLSLGFDNLTAGWPLDSTMYQLVGSWKLPMYQLAVPWIRPDPFSRPDQILRRAQHWVGKGVGLYKTGSCRLRILFQHCKKFVIVFLYRNLKAPDSLMDQLLKGIFLDILLSPLGSRTLSTGLSASPSPQA